MLHFQLLTAATESNRRLVASEHAKKVVKVRLEKCMIFFCLLDGLKIMSDSETKIFGIGCNKTLRPHIFLVNREQSRLC